MGVSNENLVVNKERIWNRLRDTLSSSDGTITAVSTTFGSIADIKAREYLVSLLKSKIEAEVEVDPPS